MVQENPKDGIAIINVSHAIQAMASTALENFGVGLETDPIDQMQFNTILDEFDQNKDKEQDISKDSLKNLRILMKTNKVKKKGADYCSITAG